MNLTDPSQNTKLAPPGWKLEAALTKVSCPPPTLPIVPLLASFLNGLMGYMVQKLLSPKFPEHHQFQQIWSCALSMPWARSLYIKVLLVPSVTPASLMQPRFRPV